MALANEAGPPQESIDESRHYAPSSGRASPSTGSGSTAAPSTSTHRAGRSAAAPCPNRGPRRIDQRPSTQGPRRPRMSRRRRRWPRGCGPRSRPNRNSTSGGRPPGSTTGSGWPSWRRLPSVGRPSAWTSGPVQRPARRTVVRGGGRWYLRLAGARAGLAGADRNGRMTDCGPWSPPAERRPAEPCRGRAGGGPGPHHHRGAARLGISAASVRAAIYGLTPATARPRPVHLRLVDVAGYRVSEARRRMGQRENSRLTDAAKRAVAP